MERSGELTVRVAGGDGDPDAGQLAEFITLFRAAYNAGLAIEREVGPGTTPEAGARLLRRYLAEQNIEETNRLFGERRRDALRTKRITHDSPLQIDFSGVVWVIAIAVLLSGGKIEWKSFKAEISRGLGESIAALLAAFKPRGEAKIGYGVQTITVELSQVEFDELVRKGDPANQKRGTFQRKFVELRFRTHPTKRTLTLYPVDVAWIVRHGSKPGKGGWQGSLRKIFGRHLWTNEPKTRTVSE